MLCVIFVFTFFHLTSSSGCFVEGFVKLTDELRYSLEKHNLSISFSAYHVGLRLAEENSRYLEKIPCNPNGYFVFPIYNVNREYVIEVENVDGKDSFLGKGKVPWSKKLMVDDDFCQNSKKNRINFFLSGFSFQGKVFDYDSRGTVNEMGPDKLKVFLYSIRETKVKKISEKRTFDGGKFTFKNILPGQYKVSMHSKSKNTEEKLNDSFKFFLKTGSMKKMNDEKTGNPLLLKKGYKISGKIENSPKMNFKINLFKQFPLKNIDTVTTKEIYEKVAAEKIESFTTKFTKESGVFQFKNVPTGKFFLVPEYNTTNFELSPSILPLDVSHTIQEKKFFFKTVKFSVKSSVINPLTNFPIVGASVFINDKFQVDTDLNGQFVLRNLVKNSKILVTVKKNGMKFNSIKIKKIDPKNLHYSPLRVTAINVCVGFNHSKARKVKITSLKKTGEKNGFNGVSEKIFSVKNGSGCRYLHVKKFPKFQVEVVRMEGKRNFFPRKIFISNLIQSDSIKKINLMELSLNITGTIRFLHVPSASEKVSTDQTKIVPLKISLYKNKKIQAILRTNESRFHFYNVKPGRYSVKIQSKIYCFSQNSFKFLIKPNLKNPLKTVNARDGNKIEFVQTGIKLKFLTKKVPIGIMVNNKNVLVKKIQPGKSGIAKICHNVNKGGLGGPFEISQNSCFKFDQNSYKIDWMTAPPVKVLESGEEVEGEYFFTFSKPISVRISGKIHISDTILKSKMIYKNFSIVNHLEVEGQPLKIYRIPKKRGPGKSVFEFSFFAETNTKNRIMIEDQFLTFIPSKKVVKLTKNVKKCPKSILFNTKIGEFVTGIILNNSNQLPMGNFSVKILSKKTNRLLGSAFTDSSGKFSIGPLNIPSKGFKVKKIANGYQLQQISVNKNFFEFYAVKLSSLEIQVKNKETGEALEGVFVSLSDIDSVKMVKNVYSNGEGKVGFQNLIPGKYFIKLMLKEFDFVNQYESNINLMSPTEKVIVINGKRNQFSVFGRVSSVNNNPMFKKTVVAVSEKNGEVVSESISDRSGNFRIRGLNPNESFKIFLKKNDFSIPKLGVSIKMEKRDVKNIDFVDYSCTVVRESKMEKGSTFWGKILIPDHPLNRPKLIEVGLMGVKNRIISKTKINYGSGKKFFFFGNLKEEKGDFFVKVLGRKYRVIENAFNLVEIQSEGGIKEEVVENERINFYYTLTGILMIFLAFIFLKIYFVDLK